MIPGIDPKVDYVFKRLFGREQSRALLIHLIDSVLRPGAGQEIVEIQVLNPFNEKESFDDKLSVVDIKARDQSGRHFNVEMQMFAVRFFPKRVLYYWSRLHTQQLRAGEDYPALQPTISISFVDGVLFPGVSEYHLCFRLLDRQNRVAFTDDIEVHLIELPKVPADPAGVKGPLDAWVYFLRYAERLDTDLLPPGLNVPPIRQAMEELRMLTQDDLERERYEARLKIHRDALSLVRELSRLQEEVEKKQQEVEKKQQEAQRHQQEAQRHQQEAQRHQQEAVKKETDALKRGLGTGEKIGMIHLCQRRLNRALTPADELAALPDEELDRLVRQLESDLFG
jgi:predicted transposase/invertase (TIGR01784 family)